MVRWQFSEKSCAPECFELDFANVLDSKCFLIEKQYIVNPNVAFKKNFEKKVNYRENILTHSIVYNFTT